MKNNKVKKNWYREIIESGAFMILLFAYFIGSTIVTLVSLKLLPESFRRKNVQKIKESFDRFYEQLDIKKEGSISRMDLIEIAVRNMRAKRTRTFVTIGGMTIGIAAIVFLVSIGYGVQEMVVSRVARLEEMRQADVTPQVGGKLKINDGTISQFKDIPQVDMTLPLISVVGKVSYKSSISDMAVYGVTTEYLKQSAIKPYKGEIFDSNDFTIESKAVVEEKGSVAGVKKVEVSAGDNIRTVFFNITPSVYRAVYKSPDISSEIIGYAKRVEGLYQGDEIWGGSYKSKSGAGKSGEDSKGRSLGKWLYSEFMLWEKLEKGSKKYAEVKNENSIQIRSNGYIFEDDVQVENSPLPGVSVLGVSTTDTLPKVEIPSETGEDADKTVKKVDLSNDAKREAVINRAALKVMGIDEDEAVGKKFNVNFVVTGDLLETEDEKIESNSAEYTIVGVVPDDKTPVLYVPFIDIRSLGVVNYSQLKVVVDKKEDLAKTRHQIEAMGYVTRSVADTVLQINSIFSTAKVILAMFGLIALVVASLGMFNTLTVSLLERTREVGLMKAMGMKGYEVKQLFLTESIIMGALGGVFGIVSGLLAGNLLGLGLSIMAIFRGGGTLDISYLPLAFVLFIILLSFSVGILTGIYPAKRATKISVLDALRYE